MINPLVERAPKEIRLRQPPIARVVCVVNFAPVMKIVEPDGTGIAQFQDIIRGRYPKLEQRLHPMMEFATPERGKPPVPRFVNQVIWEFLEGDESWRVALSHSFLALDTRIDYVDREAFVLRLVSLLSAARDTLGIAQRTRIGVRYVNIFRDRRLRRIGKILRPELTGFCTRPFATGVVTTTTTSEFEVPEGRLIVKSGLLAPQQTHDPMVLEPVDKYSFYVDLDAIDLNAGAFSPEEIEEVVRGLTHRVYSFFRWAVRAELLEERDDA